MASSFLPVQCRSCSKLELALARPGQVPSCRKCGEPVVFLPGASYLETDIPLFERIEDAIRPLIISRRNAERVVAELRNVALRAEAPESALLRVVDLLPSLHFLIPSLYLQPALAVERSKLGRAAGMVLTIMSARLRELEARSL